MKEFNVELAKKRIWKRLEAKLPERGNPGFSPVFSMLRASIEDLKPSRLKKVQAKEHLLDILPDKEFAVSSFFPSRLVSLGTLGLLVGVLFVPLMDLTPSVSAASQNSLELIGGDVYVNGVKVTETTILQVGDTVETGDGAMAHLTFVDDSRFTLGPSSKVDIVDAWIDTSNRSNSRIELTQNRGRSWSQVLNLSDDASFTVNFPQGKVWVSQRASFDVQVNDGTSTVEVARNLVDLDVTAGENEYSGILGQGAELSISDDIQTQEVSDAEQNDVWWTFNLAYGKSYARTLDESYQKENISHALILPGNPLYGLKTFREDMQISFAFTDGAKHDLLIQQAEIRLNEAQVLLAQGNTESAAAVLKVYQETVDAVQVTSPSDELLVLEDEAQKEALTDNVGSEGDSVLQDHFDANTYLQSVPDLIADGRFDDAVSILKSYDESSFSFLNQLEDISMEDREAAVSDLLNQKLADLQLLKVIAAMPELSGSLDLSNTILKELSVMVLSLREKELGDLTTYFDMNDEDISIQEDLYEHLKNDAPMTDELSDQFDEVQEQIASPVESLVVDIHPVEEVAPVAVEGETVLDPRFDVPSVPHTDETKD